MSDYIPCPRCKTRPLCWDYDQQGRFMHCYTCGHRQPVPGYTRQDRDRAVRDVERAADAVRGRLPVPEHVPEQGENER